MEIEVKKPRKEAEPEAERPRVWPPVGRPTKVEPPKKHHEYVLENLRMMPMVAGTGSVTHDAVLKGWADHLIETGMAAREYLETLADEDGNIHISKLPPRQKKLGVPLRGPRHGFNNARRWLPVDAPEPPLPVVQDPRLLTAQEQEAQLGIYREMGKIPQNVPKRDVAVVIK